MLLLPRAQASTHEQPSAPPLYPQLFQPSPITYPTVAPPVAGHALHSAQWCLAQLRLPADTPFRGQVRRPKPDPRELLRQYYRALAVAEALARDPALAESVAQCLPQFDLPADVAPLVAQAVGGAAKPPAGSAAVAPPEPTAPPTHVFSSRPLGQRRLSGKDLQSCLKLGNLAAFDVDDISLELLFGLICNDAARLQPQPTAAWFTAVWRALERMADLGLATNNAQIPRLVAYCLDAANATCLAEAGVAKALGRLILRLNSHPSHFSYGAPSKPLVNLKDFMTAWAQVGRMVAGEHALPPARGKVAAARDAMRTIAPQSATSAVDAAIAWTRAIACPDVDLNALVREAVRAHSAAELQRIDFICLPRRVASDLLDAVMRLEHVGLIVTLLGLSTTGGEDALQERLEQFGYDAFDARRWSTLASQCQQLDPPSLAMALQPACQPMPSYAFVPLRVQLAAMAELEVGTIDVLLRGHQQGWTPAAVRAVMERAALSQNAGAQAAVGHYLAQQANLTPSVLHAAGVGGRHQTVFKYLWDALLKDADGCLGEAFETQAVARLIDGIHHASHCIPRAEVVSHVLHHIHTHSPAASISLGHADRLLGGVAPYRQSSRQLVGGTVLLGGVLLSVNDDPDRDVNRIPKLAAAALCLTAGVRADLAKIAALYRCGKAILYEGPTGCGKNALIAYIAAQTQTPVHEVVLSADTRKSDLLGGWMPASATFSAADLGNLSPEQLRRLVCNFGLTPAAQRAAQQEQVLAAQATIHWVDGPVVRAIKRGEIVLLRQLNLASTSVVECLNSLLDSDGKLVLTEHRGEEVAPAPGSPFRMMATQHPKSLGSVEQSLPFLSRWCKVVATPRGFVDWLPVVHSIIPDAAAAQRDRLLTAHGALVTAVQKRTIGAVLGGNYSVRHLQKAARRFMRYRQANAASDATIMMREVQEVYGGLAWGHEQAQLRDILQKNWPDATQAATASPQLQLTADAITLDDVSLPRYHIDHANVPADRLHAALTPRIEALMYAICKAKAAGENILLVGEHATSKGVTLTQVVQLQGRRLYRQLADEQMDSAELVGSFTPTGFQPGLLMRACEAANPPADFFLDEINLCPPEQLQRLGPFLKDRRGTLLVDMEGQTPQVSDDFMMCAAMNPPATARGSGHRAAGNAGRNMLSEELLDVFTIIQAQPPTCDEVQTLAMVRGTHAGLPEDLSQALSELHTTVQQWQQVDLPVHSLTVEQPKVSIRALENAVDLVGELWQELGEKAAFAQAAQIFYPHTADLDALVEALSDRQGAGDKS